MNQLVNARQFKNSTSARRSHMAAIDIGTSKVACLITDVNATPGEEKNAGKSASEKTSNESAPQASAANNSRPIVSGFGHHLSQGLMGGQVVDMAAAEGSIRAAVDQAERMAGVEVRKITVGVSALGLSTEIGSVEVRLEGQVVSDEHLRMALHHTCEKLYRPDYEILHVEPITYALDGGGRILDPRGMYGEVLQVRLLVVRVPLGPLRNLLSCIEKCHLECEKLIVTPYASALSTLNQDEMDLGVLHIDMGAGTTSFVIYYEDAPLHFGVLPVGGMNVTRDLARGLNISASMAERLKTLHGSALGSSKAFGDEIDLSTADHDGPVVPLRQLTEIIRPRLEETFEMVRDHIQKSGFDRYIGRRVVLTGGASQLNGAKELAAQILERDVRLATPMRLTGLPDMASGPAFAACAGLVAYSRREHTDQLLSEAVGYGRVGRMMDWLKRNF